MKINLFSHCPQLGKLKFGSKAWPVIIQHVAEVLTGKVFFHPRDLCQVGYIANSNQEQWDKLCEKNTFSHITSGGGATIEVASDASNVLTIS